MGRRHRRPRDSNVLGRHPRQSGRNPVGCPPCRNLPHRARRLVGRCPARNVGQPAEARNLVTNHCRTVQADAGSLYPAALDRKAPGETYRIEHDLTRDADCAGVGVTLTVSAWAVHPDDDDGSLTLSAETIAGLVTSVAVAGGTDGANYRLVNTVNVSDGQILERTSSLPVLETRALNA